MKVYFAADHAGFELKNALLPFVRDELGHEVEDCGAFSFDAEDDYPEFISQGARKLSDDALAGRDSRGIFPGGSGQGEAMMANRFKGIRAAVYYGPAPKFQTDSDGKALNIVVSTREHNNANVLALGARFLGTDEAKGVVAEWLATPFSGGERHARRNAALG